MPASWTVSPSQAERHLAGGQDPQARRGRQHPLGGRADLVDDVLAVVEQQQRVQPAQPVEHHRLGGLADAQRVADALPDRGRVLSSRTSQAPPAGPGRLDRQPGLAHPGRAHHGDQPCAAVRCRDRREVARPGRSDRRSGRADSRYGGRPSCRRIRCCSVLQLRARIQPELVGQQRPHPGVGGQRVRLASGPVQRGDQQLPQAFAQRVRRRPAPRVTDHLCGRGPARGGPRSAAAAALPGGSGAARASRRPRRPAGSPRGTAPGPSRQIPGGHHLPGRPQFGDPAGQPHHLGRVHARRVDVQRVPGAPPVSSPGSPSARRSLDTLACNVFRATPALCPDHRSSISRSVRTSSPASRARRISTSVSSRPAPRAAHRRGAGRPAPAPNGQHIPEHRPGRQPRVSVASALFAEVSP